MKKTLVRPFGAALAAAVFPILVSCVGKAEISPGTLTCEYRENPVTDLARPRLSWINTAPADRRGLRQTAWQVQVASSPELLRRDRPDLWDSGKVPGDQSTLVGYQGEPLSSRQHCWWRVRVWDGKGRVSAWSDLSWWHMGILDPDEWQGQWIGAPWQGEESVETSGQQATPAAPLLRKSFETDREVASAWFYGAGLGYFELYLNGEKVGDDVLSPNQTNYGKRPGLEQRQIPVEDHFREYRVLYPAYEVTDRIRRGENVLGAVLGNGFYDVKYRWVMPYGSPRFVGQLHIVYTDGSQQVIATDTTWRASRSAILQDGVYIGEHYDARAEQPGWAAPGFDDTAWQPAARRRAPEGEMVAQNGPPDRVMERLEPVRVEKLGEGRYRLDFGQEISGWLSLEDIEGPAGQRIDLRYLSESPMGTNSYTLRGEGKESYRPRFTWFVFREAEISGWPGELRPGQVTAEAVYSDVERTGHFECSDTLFNTIHRIWLRSQLDNMHGGVASDCPHRERCAYTGDGQVACVTVMHNLDAAAFYDKWIRDIWGAQNPETGYVPNGAPWEPGCGGGPGWGAAMNIMPWEFYVHYGDTAMLEGTFEAMKQQVAFMRRWVQPDGTMHMQDPCPWKNLGDWCPAYELPPAAMVHTLFLWRCADLTARAAAVLGRTEDEQTYRELARRTAEAFHRRFYDPQKGTYGRYGGNIFALQIGVPDSCRARVTASLRADIRANGGHLDTGIFGTQFFFETLADNGLDSLAYVAMSRRDYPGFGHWIRQGATTTWEQWDGGNSHNHPMFGGSLTWFYRRLAGMNADPAQPGYRHIVFRPQPAGDIAWAEYGNRTPYGYAGIRWERTDGAFSMTVDVPVGSTATVYVPGAASADRIRVNGSAREDENAVFKGIRDGYAVYEVGQGRYAFRSI